MKNAQQLSNRPRLLLLQGPVLVARKSLVTATLIVLMTLLVIPKVTKGANNGNLRYTTKAGAWNNKKNWFNEDLPQAGDSIVVLHDMVGVSNFTLGSNNQGALVIGPGVTFTPNGMTFESNARLYNEGTISFSSNPNWNGSPVWILNSGDITFRQTLAPNGALNFYNYENATLNVTRTTTLPSSSLLYNEGTMKLNNGLTANQNTNIRNMDGTMSIGATGGSILLEGVTNFENAEGATLNLLRSVTTQNQMTTFNNSGELNFGSPSSAANSVLNVVTINNTATGTLQHYGDMTINSGSSNPMNTISNDGEFFIFGDLTTDSPSEITTTDTMYVRDISDIGSELNVEGENARFVSGGDMFLRNKNGAAINLVDGGGILANEDFTVESNRIVTGTGVGNKITVVGVSTNNGTMTGEFDLCDMSGAGVPGLVDGGSGTVNSGVSNCMASPLPVEFLAFSAQPNAKGGADLRWSTASELNNAFFVVERSDDGRSFRKIGVVQGNGTKMTVSHYQFADNMPINGMVFYRLHQFDYNGDNEYSKTISLNPQMVSNTEQLTIQTYPTLVSLRSSAAVVVRYELTNSTPVLTELVNASGQVVARNSDYLPAGATLKELGLAGLAPGAAFIRVSYQDTVATQKIMVQP